jgi:hypothetical protein
MLGHMAHVVDRRRAPAGHPPHPHRLTALLLAVVAAALLVTSGQAPAGASCASISRSPWSFAGVVTQVSSDDRIATVRTDDGRLVEVRGALHHSFTSIDRTYSPGGRYEFHPLNDSSPFEDNNCTATHLLSQGPVPPAERASRVGPVAGAAAALLILTVIISVRRSRRH